ncbi:flagellar type III secretion system pore protein FliP [Microbulbifer sp. ALW1]|uniref:flagellar type III secretion system pore protein FliP n=1 Tax=Microbulbifer sp. (strain ALW1) TaxID=1516059 RepID=UPI00135B59BB|nr:flagellar type III secretion system pore protein FliP [Microbulbifer sp. ALW1]
MAEQFSWFTILTSLTFLPFFLVAVTPFLRFIIVFSAIRYALGLQQSPPNIVLIALAIFTTVAVMGDIPNQIYSSVLLPLSEQDITMKAAADEISNVAKGWMIPRVSGDDLEAVYAMSQSAVPASAEEVSITKLMPAYMLSELAYGFKAAFFVMVPFLLVDLVVSGVLMSLGMIMLPPITVSMPIKLMLFVLLDGWSLITLNLAQSTSI